MGRRKPEKRKRSSNVSEEDERERVKESILKVFRARLESPSKGGALLVGQSKQKEECDASQSADTMNGRSRSKKKPTQRKKIWNKKSPVTVHSDNAVSKHMKVAHGMVNSHGKEKEASGMLVSRIAPFRITQKVGLFNTGKKSRPAAKGILIPEHIQKQTEADLKKIINETDSFYLSTDPDHTDSLQPKPFKSCTSKSLENSCTVVEKKTPKMKYTSSVVTSGTISRSSCSDFSMEGSLEPLIMKETLHDMMLPLGPLLKRMCPGRDYMRETIIGLKKLMKQNAPRSATPTPIPSLTKIRLSGGIQRSLFADSVQQPQEPFVKSPGLDPARSCKNNPLEKLIIKQFEPLVPSKPAVDLLSTQIFTCDKTKDLHAEINNKSAQTCYNDKLINHDMNHYRSRLLGLERQDNAVHRSSNNLFFSKGSMDSSQTCKWLPEIKETNNSLCNINRNNFVRYKQTEKHYDIGSDVCMMPRDEFSAFFEDFKLEANKTCVSEEKCIASTRSSIGPIDCDMQDGNIVSPAVDHEALVMLLANDNRSTNRQLYEPMESESRVEDALNLLQKNDMMQTVNGKRQSQEYDCSCREARSNSQNSEGSASHSSQSKVLYMPGFHGDYYTDHLNMKDIVWQKTEPTVKEVSMDILDHVDLDTKLEIQQDTKPYNIFDHVDLDTKLEIKQDTKPYYRGEVKDILQAASIYSLDSSRKPVDTLPVLRSNHTKPSTSPDSPDLIMSPRKMY